MRAMARGVIKKVVEVRGFGFVREDDAMDHFFHMKDLAPDGGLVWGEHLIGQQVEFSFQQTPKGTRAVDVREVR